MRRVLTKSEVGHLAQVTHRVGRDLAKAVSGQNLDDFRLVLHEDILPQVSEVCGVEVIRSPYVPREGTGYLIKANRVNVGIPEPRP